MGILPGNLTSFANAISADGSTVVGVSYGSSQRAFRWTASTGLVALNASAGDLTFMEALSVSGDGSVIVGKALKGPNRVAFRWTASAGAVVLAADAGAWGVSRDGSVTVGDSIYSGAVRWLSSGEMLTLDGSTTFHGSLAEAISANNEFIVGYGTSGSPGPQGFRWSQSRGFELVDSLTNDWSESVPFAVSADGAVIVGRGRESSFAAPQAFRWTASTGLVPLDGLSNTGSVAHALSDSGATIVGTYRNSQGQRAFIWDEDHGMRDLGDLLAARGVLPAGWRLQSATGISADGLTICGYGQNPLGATEAWITPIPEPATLAMLVLAAFGVSRRQPRA